MISLGALKEATGSEAVTAFVSEQVLPGTDWNLVAVRRRSIRLEPPHTYWATYRVRVGRGELIFPEPGPETGDELPEAAWSEQRELRLVARGVFDSGLWAGYRDRLAATYGGRPCRPLDDIGYPAWFDATQHAFWFYPVDPNLPALTEAADANAMRRLFRNDKREVLEVPARIADVSVEVARYQPEIAAILRYDLDCIPAIASRSVFGKVQPGDRSAETNRIVTAIWLAARASDGKLSVAKPLAHYPRLGMSVQSSLEGEAIGNDRTAPEFQAAALHAAEALAVLHGSAIPIDRRLPLEGETHRLERTLDQFAVVHPNAYFLLREFMAHLRQHLHKLPEEDWLPTHGDFKYDQILHVDGRFSIIDFDFFGVAETSFDLGKYCAYLVPSQPKGWEQSFAAEEARTRFLARYCELRPGATLHRFPIYESVNLAERAMTMMWMQLPGWEKAAEMLLVLAMERLKSRAPQLTAS